jgi:hypothetical protein
LYVVGRTIDCGTLALSEAQHSNNRQQA